MEERAPRFSTEYFEPRDAICFAGYNTGVTIYIIYIKIHAYSSRLLGQFNFNCKRIMRIYKHAKLSCIIFMNKHGSGPMMCAHVRVRVCVSVFVFCDKLALSRFNT